VRIDDPGEDPSPGEDPVRRLPRREHDDAPRAELGEKTAWVPPSAAIVVTLAKSFSAQPHEDIKTEVAKHLSANMEPIGQALTTVLGKLGRAITEDFNEEKTTAVAPIDFSVAAIKRRRRRASTRR
jgi:hypothetical protein